MILTTGTFDGVHVGHLNLLGRAAVLASQLPAEFTRRVNTLRVGVLSDQMVTEYRGRAPLFSEAERVQQIKDALSWIVPMLEVKYEVEIVTNEREFFLKGYGDVIVVGSDWLTRDVLAHWGITSRDLAERNTAIHVVPYTAGISSTKLRGGSQFYMVDEVFSDFEVEGR